MWADDLIAENVPINADASCVFLTPSSHQSLFTEEDAQSAF